ncbi:MAG TPA: hydroxysqualene dehydroxylase HpnE [Vicinamibacterales bacterium]|nr:hydroxysqualene dehydroxylase HpnE [Vicinamibacterales bacterium]
MNTFDAIIVGGGVAGLSAAVRLTSSGARVLVLEKTSRLGGRTTSFPDRQSGDIVDNGQHVLLGCYRETLAFLEAIGSDTALRRQPVLRVPMIDRTGHASTLICPQLPSPLHLVAGVIDWDALDWRDRIAILRMAQPIRLAREEFKDDINGSRTRHRAEPRRIAASPGETVHAWLVRNGQTERLRELLWEPLALAALNQPTTHAAAPAFTRVLAEMFGADPKASTVLIPNAPLNQVFGEPARGFVTSRGGEVRLGAAATIEVNHNRCAVHVNDETLQAPHVIAAVPWFSLDTLFTGDTTRIEAILEPMRRLDPSPIVTANLWFDRPVMDEAFVGLPGRRFQWVFDKGALFGGRTTHLSLVSSGASVLSDLDHDQVVSAALEDVRDAIPAARPAQVLRGSVIREPRATFSLAPGQPGRPGTVTPIENLFLAGDWTDTGLPATIEGAVRSGHRAAAACLPRSD